MRFLKELVLVVIFCSLYEARAFDHFGQQAFGKIDEGAIAMGFLAKEMCSCLFVTGQSEEYCRDYTVFGPLKDLNFSLNIDWENKKVRASTFLVISKRAEYQSDNLGCKLVR